MARGTGGLSSPVTARQTKSHKGHTAIAAFHVAMVLLSVGVAVIWRMPEATVVGAPSLAILVAGLLAEPVAPVAVSAATGQPRALAGDIVELNVSVSTAADVALLGVEMHRRDPEYAGPSRWFCSVAKQAPAEVSFQLKFNEWGVRQIGDITTRATDRFMLTNRFYRYQLKTPIRVHIREAPVSAVQDPTQFRRFVGSHVAPDRAEGLDFADVRPYEAGDRLRSLNWRISARRDEPWVTLRHPDRSTNVIIVLDALRAVHRGSHDLQRRAIQATLGIARLHSTAQDPVGLLIVGHGIRWLPPRTGKLHLHEISEALLELSNRDWPKSPMNLETVKRVMPKASVVIAISPLRDRVLRRFLDELTSTGRQVDVIQPLPAHDTFRLVQSAGFANRLYDLAEEAERDAIRARGMSVHPWSPERPLDAVLRSMQQHRRRVGARA